MVLFFLPLAKAALAFLPTAHSVALRPPFPFWQAQYVQVSPLKPVLFCKLSAGFGSTNKCAIFFLFYFSLTLALTSPPRSLLHETFWQIWQELCSNFFCTIRPGLNTCFFQGMTRLMNWPDGERYSNLLQSLVVSLF